MAKAPADFPDDADGDALRRLAEMGVDLSQPITVDFAVAVPNRDAAIAVAEAATEVGYKVDVFHDTESDAYSCYCARTLVPTYEALLRVQAQLDELAQPFGGFADGWGSFGETPPDRSPDESKRRPNG